MEYEQKTQETLYGLPSFVSIAMASGDNVEDGGCFVDPSSAVKVEWTSGFS